MMNIIKLDNVNYKYSSSLNNCLNDVSFEIRSGETIGLMGPNGSGKTTLVKIISGLLGGFSGNVEICGKPIQKHSNIEIAKIMSYIPQADNYIFDFTVEEIIAMGRRPYLDTFGILAKKDRDIIANVVNLLSMDKIIKRKYLSLSGGERRLVLIARALAQETSVLLMDEPTTYLDLNYKIIFMNKLKELNKMGKTIFLISHDINLVAEYLNRIILLKGGRVICDGPTKDVLNEKNISEIFNIKDFMIDFNRITGNPNLFFIPSKKTEV
jgi:iron complex transport system ATP-binding protein